MRGTHLDAADVHVDVEVTRVDERIGQGVDKRVAGMVVLGHVVAEHHGGAILCLVRQLDLVVGELGIDLGLGTCNRIGRHPIEGDAEVGKRAGRDAAPEGMGGLGRRHRGSDGLDVLLAFLFGCGIFLRIGCGTCLGVRCIGFGGMSLCHILTLIRCGCGIVGRLGSLGIGSGAPTRRPLGKCPCRH